MAFRFGLICVVAASLLMAFDLANGLQDTYVVKTLGVNDECVNLTRPMGGNAKCKVPLFKVVNMTVPDATETLDMVDGVLGTIALECKETVINLLCVMYEVACSADEKYQVMLVDQAGCMGYLTCVPEAILATGSKQGICDQLPDKTTVTIVEGPSFEIVVKPRTTSASSRILLSVLNLVGSVLLFIVFS